jgi:hypothetical protein
MRSVKYVGRFAEVEIQTGPERWRPVKRGVPTEVADDLAASLCEQDCWEYAEGGGTIDEVLAQVGGDIDKARQALEEERAGKGRKRLLEQLEQLVAEPGDVNDGAERPKEENTDG